MATNDERKKELDKIKLQAKETLKKIKEEERIANIEHLKGVKEIIKKNFVIEIEKPVNLGGQHCGMPVHAVIVKSSDLEIEIKVKHYRSNHQNRELAMLLMELAMDEIIK